MNIFERSIRSVHSGGLLGFARNLRDFAASQAVLLYEAAVLTVGSGAMIRSFQRGSKGLSRIDDLIGFAFGFSYMGVRMRPVQHKEEIAEFLLLLRKRRVRALLEIGTDRGGTLFLFARVAAPDAKILSMNLPWSSLNAYCMRYRNMLYGRFAGPGQKLSLLTVNSHERSSLSKAKKLLKSGKLDFLFIDGDHSYEGVKKDFEMYAPLVRRGGIIGLHDIAKNSGQNVNPVRDYWQSVKKAYKHKELEYSDGKGYGIGIIYW